VDIADSAYDINCFFNIINPKTTARQDIFIGLSMQISKSITEFELLRLKDLKIQEFKDSRI
jgi:hypothetical protein